MRKNVWIVAVAVLIVFGGAGYTIAQTTSGGPQGGQGGMMGGGMMGGGQGGMMGGGMMGSGMMNMMMGQPLTQDQLEQFAKQHGITTEQAQQMTEACTQVMRGTTTPQTQPQ